MKERLFNVGEEVRFCDFFGCEPLSVIKDCLESGSVDAIDGCLYWFDVLSTGGADPLEAVVRITDFQEV